MKKRVFLFFIILFAMTLIPIIIFPRSTSLEDAQYNLASELFQRGRYSEAIVEFRRLLFTMKTRKYKDACYYFAGSAYFHSKQYTSAANNFKLVVRKYPSSKYHSKALYFLARSEYLLGEYKTSIQLFDTYVRKYPPLDYADNSLYWKAEALLSLGSREKAKSVLRDLLKRYPYGNKADAARFKLRLMELEEKKSVGGTQAGQAQDQAFLEEIDRLNNQIEYLKTEINNLKEVGSGTSDEQLKQIQEKIKALVSWENVLRIKEETLNQKELELNGQYEIIVKIQKALEGDKDE